ncbi:MAG TPA: hypothetical protein VN329_03110 [Roseomonas sp.]|nr:hypothetical protein [Roseomonas sp.]
MRQFPRLRLLRLLPVLAAAFSAAPAAAQDSFVRVADAGTGRPMVSVLGTGMGLPYASLALEMRCPTANAWIIEVTGVQAAPGTPVTFGFGDPQGGFAEIQAAPIRFEEDRLRVSVDRQEFRAALAQARADYPRAAGADARVVIGGAVGVSVQRDALVREMTAFAGDCDPVRSPRARLWERRAVR